jgi:DNA-binding response OmpR family regulator
MKGKKILVIDDDKDIIDAIQIILQLQGYTVATSAKGDETYAMVYDFKPDLVLLDVLMSGSDGRTICKKLKHDKVTTAIPIVMMSAHPSAVKEYLQCGANDFLAKPFETDDLIKIVKKHLNRTI